MDDKSHVSLEQHVCLVCGQAYETGSILLDRRLRASLVHHTVTGWGLCPAHQKLFDEGFVALVECDPARSAAPSADGRVKPEQAFRTGQVAHVKRHVFAGLFKAEIAPDQPCVFVEPGLIDQLAAMVKPD